MKVKVLREFVDKHTNKLHEVGEVFEADQKRVEEINEAYTDLIEIVKGDKNVRTATAEIR